MHRSGDGKGLTQRFFLILQIRNVLEVVGINVAIRQQLVGVNAAGEFDHFDIEAGIDFFDVIEDLSVWYRVSGNAQRGSLGGCPCQRKR